MSDLISRSALIEEMKKAEIEYENAMMCPSWWSAFNIIREQPTAYSVDKVVEELELHSFELGTDTLPVHYVRLNEAIEIVKQGSDTDASDNVCECRKLKDYKSLFKTSCGYIFAREGFKYCPYCGKKIKIKAVE